MPQFFQQTVGGGAKKKIITQSRRGRGKEKQVWLFIFLYLP